MRWLYLLALAGCGRFGFDGTANGGDGGGPGGDGDGGNLGDATGDLTDGAMPDGVAGSGCTQPATFCAFDGATPCSCWGMANTVFASMTESNGRLTITPNANQAGAQGSCLRTNVPLDAAGIFVEVSSVVQSANGLTALSVGSSPDIFEISVTNNQWRHTDGSNTGGSTYDPVAMRWWRIRPVSGGTVFDVSPDGKAWTTRVTYGRLPSASYNVRLIGGTIGGVASPGTAQFESVNVCPP